jgi:hypothetical protein
MIKKPPHATACLKLFVGEKYEIIKFIEKGTTVHVDFFVSSLEKRAVYIFVS